MDSIWTGRCFRETHPASLPDQFAGFVAEVNDRNRLAQRTLEVVMMLSNGRSGAVFEVSDDRLTLFASRGIDQHVLDAVQTLWGRAKDQLRGGQPLYVADCATDRDLASPTATGGPASLAVFPVFDGNDLVALLYVDGQEPSFSHPRDIERLTRFSRLLAGTVERDAPRVSREPRDWEAYLEQTPVAEIEREKLLLLLNRNDWNISRVARLMGMTRRTVYLRLQRYNIPRERIFKTRMRSAAAS